MNRTDRCSKNVPQTQQKKHPRCGMKLTKILTQLYRNQTKHGFSPKNRIPSEFPAMGITRGKCL